MTRWAAAILLLASVINSNAQITGPPSKVLQITTGHQHTCALVDNNGVKCWGDNVSGQIGIPLNGRTENIGVVPGDMGNDLPWVLLGLGNVIGVVSGEDHTCAVFATGVPRCWGDGGEGQLGNEDGDSVGLSASEMGENLVEAVGISSVMKIAPHNDFTCVLITGGCVKCFGKNAYGVLGNPNLSYNEEIGDESGEMSSLQCIDMGSAPTEVIDLSHGTGAKHMCMVFHDGLVKCMGNNSHGQLGLGNTSSPNAVGDALPYVDVGNTEGEVVEVAVGKEHTCARFISGCVKCWGRGEAGRLGTGSDQDVGDTPGQMGNNLECVDLGAGHIATRVAAGEHHTCVILDNGGVKCFGRNSYGQLGLGDRKDRGLKKKQMGDDLPVVDIGPPGTTALAIACGGQHTCVITNCHEVKCWGFGASGALGYASPDNVGDGVGMPMQGLPAINLWEDLPDEADDDLSAEDTQATGDPHFIGFDGSRYDYDGIPGATFALLQTADVAVNAHLVGHRVTVHHDQEVSLTYMDVIAISASGARIMIFAGKGRIHLEVNEAEAPAYTPGRPLSIRITEDASVLVTGHESVEVKIPGFVFEIALRHGRFLDLRRVGLTRPFAAGEIHGVLGQTAIEGRGVGGYVGEDSDYFVASLWDYDFKYGGLFEHESVQVHPVNFEASGMKTMDRILAKLLRPAAGDEPTFWDNPSTVGEALVVTD